jgi:hypothetical protein
VAQKLNPALLQAGFSAEYHTVEIRSSSVLVVVATVSHTDQE